MVSGLVSSSYASAKVSIVTPSASGVIYASTSYSISYEVPTEASPYFVSKKDLNGTVFIAVGTIILSLLSILLFLRFWFWLKNRKAARDATKVSIDDYYGTFYDHSDSYSSFADYDEKKSANSLTLNYDTNVFAARKATSSNNSFFSNHSSSSSTNSATHTPNDTPSHHMNRPGHQLRSALSSANHSPSQMVNTKRASYISPINELIHGGENRMSSFVSLDNLGTDVSDESKASLATTKHRKSSSISLLLQQDQNANRNVRSSSVDLRHLHQMVEQSLEPSQQPQSTPATANKEFKKGHSRPPSLILDMLMKQDE